MNHFEDLPKGKLNDCLSQYRVRTLFLSRVDNEPQLSFHDLLDSEHLHVSIIIKVFFMA